MISIKRITYATCILLAFTSCGGNSGGSSGVPSEPSGPNTPTPTTVTGISLNKTTLTLIEGSSETITATITPSTAANKSISWSSSDNNIAIVDNGGKITAKNPGTTKISATTVDGNKTVTLYLTVDIDYIVRQKDILKIIFENLGGTSWTKKDGWNTDADLKEWFGITMNGDNITSINLSNNNLKGKIPSDLGKMLAVTRTLIDTDTRSESEDNAITRSEESIVIFGNLKELDLSNNQISGSIPAEIGNLTSLATLNLSNNNLTGGLPATIINLTKLENLSVENNQLSEKLSNEILNSDMWKNLKTDPNLTQQGGITLDPSSETTGITTSSIIPLNDGGSW